MTAAYADLARVSVGTSLPSLHFNPTVAKTVLTPAATFDSYPVHYDLEFARRLGLPNMFLNSMPLLGLVNRLVTDWAGPDVFVIKHEIVIKRSVYVGIPIRVEGTVAALSPVPDRQTRLTTGPMVEVDVSIWSAEDQCVTASISLARRGITE
jgi:3-oxo-4,17-pregnadiene-20-carboxyl-CoA hydratase beta subunit